MAVGNRQRSAVGKSSAAGFYTHLYEMIREALETGFQRRGLMLSRALVDFLEGTTLTDHVSMLDFFRHLGSLLAREAGEQKGVSCSWVFLPPYRNGLRES